MAEERTNFASSRPGPPERTDPGRHGGGTAALEACAAELRHLLGAGALGAVGAEVIELEQGCLQEHSVEPRAS